jgi:hypothetical protein
MTAINLLSQHPIREICDYLHIYPSWGWRMENVVSKGRDVATFDLVKTHKNINKTIHITNVDGLGFCITAVSEGINQLPGIAA